MPTSALTRIAGAGLLAAGLIVGVAACTPVSSDASTPKKSTSTPASPSAQTSRADALASALPSAPDFEVRLPSLGGAKFAPENFSGVFGVPGGKDVSPALSWSGFPAGTKSFVVTAFDADAPTGSGFWHWVVAGIPASVTSLQEGAGSAAAPKLPQGATAFANDAGVKGYIGAAPPKGSGDHHYVFTVPALAVSAADAGVTGSESPALLGFKIGAHTIARGESTVVARG